MCTTLGAVLCYHVLTSICYAPKHKNHTGLAEVICLIMILRAEGGVPVLQHGRPQGFLNVLLLQTKWQDSVNYC